MAYAETVHGPAHVLVKFSELPDSPVSQRWRDLLLAEHMALATLRAAGIPAAQSAVLDHGGQRFLEVERFDRVGTLGRRALVSLAAMEAEFVGAAHKPWPVLTSALATQGVITPEAAETASLLWAFGALIGNTDMHSGNVSFMSEHGRPYQAAPAYDMTPMAFAPGSSGRLPDTVPAAVLHASVSNAQWHTALALARQYLKALQASRQFSLDFGACLQAMRWHIEGASAQIDRLA